MSAWLEALKGAEAPLGIIVGAFGKGLFDRKVKADAANVVTQSAVLLLGPLNERIDDLTKRVASLEAEDVKTKSALRTAIDYINQLRSWIAQHVPGKTPPSPPSTLAI